MKTRRQGNAIVLTVPSKFGIEENVEYLAIKGTNDSITFIKKKKIFLKKQPKTERGLMLAQDYLKNDW